MGKFSYQDSGIEDNIQVVPYAQLLNPIKHPQIGFGITKDQAELAGFTPDKNWLEKEIMLGDDATPVYVSKNTRLLILAQSELMMSKDASILKYDPIKRQREGYKPLSYLVVWFVGEDNKPLSDLPFRVKTSSVAGKSIRDAFKAWQGTLLSSYKALEGTTKGLTWSAGVFSVEWTKTQVDTPDKTKVSVSTVKDFLKLTPENLENNFILPGSETGKKLVETKELIKDWCNLVQVSKEKEYEAIEQDANLVNSCLEKFRELGWGNVAQSHFVRENFGKPLNNFSNDDLETLKALLSGEILTEEELDDAPF